MSFKLISKLIDFPGAIVILLLLTTSVTFLGLIIIGISE